MQRLKLLKYFALAVTLLLGCYLFKKTHLHHYFKGKRALESFLNYQQSHPFSPKPSEAFCYIAHAGGGYQGRSYLNTLEAIENSYRMGVNYVEIDFHYTMDSVVVLAHDYVEKTEAEFLSDKESGTHLSLTDFLKWLSNKNIFLITDIKVDNVKVLKWIAENNPELLDKIIPQAYSIPEIVDIKELGYENIIFTNYVSFYPNTIIKELAATKALFAITLPYNTNMKLWQYFGGFKDMDTPIFGHTINDQFVAQKLLKSGCKGVYTDELLQSSITIKSDSEIAR